MNAIDRRYNEKIHRLLLAQLKPYPSIDSTPQTLNQNRGQQVAIINKIKASNDITHELKAIKDKSLITSVAIDVKNSPLWKLQQLPNHIDDFLYEQREGENDIILRTGVAFSLEYFTVR